MAQKNIHPGPALRWARLRAWTQTFWLLLLNSYWLFPFTKTIYQGPLKILCSPGLNCYSCPAAVTACPLGALQQMLAGARVLFTTGTHIGLYVVGSMGLMAMGFGRFICGWACPFGLLQDLLYKVPGKKHPILPILHHLKYFFLLVFVVLLPVLLVDDFGGGKPWFCKYVCPAGTLEAGLPLLLLFPDLRSMIGLLFWTKLSILVLFIGWSTTASRPFCRTTCPLGAFYGIFNGLSLIQLKFMPDNCTKCEACSQICPVDIHFYQAPSSRECVRCLRCYTEACAFDAIYLDVAGYRKSSPLIRIQQSRSTSVQMKTNEK